MVHGIVLSRTAFPSWRLSLRVFRVKSFCWQHTASMTSLHGTPNGQGFLIMNNPVDLYREKISQALAPITGKASQDVYERLAWIQTFDKGDLGLAVPSLRIKGNSANQVNKWSEKFVESEWMAKPVVAGPFFSSFSSQSHSLSWLFHLSWRGRLSTVSTTN